MIAFHFNDEDTSSEVPQLVRKAVANAMVKRLGPKFAALNRPTASKNIAAEEVNKEEIKKE